MSNIWNPHAFGVTGQPVGPQVNTLRVYGAEPSKEQFAMAQQAFAKFCMTERLSFAPNQTQQGFLPDGSKYRIVVVNGTRIMEVRPIGVGSDDILRGILLQFSGTADQILLTPGGGFATPDGSWKKTKVKGWMVGFSDKYMLTGTRLPGWANNSWVSTDSKKWLIQGSQGEWVFTSGKLAAEISTIHGMVGFTSMTGSPPWYTYTVIAFDGNGRVFKEYGQSEENIFARKIPTPQISCGGSDEIANIDDLPGVYSYISNYSINRYGDHVLLNTAKLGEKGSPHDGSSPVYLNYRNDHYLSFSNTIPPRLIWKSPGSLLGLYSVNRPVPEVWNASIGGYSRIYAGPEASASPLTECYAGAVGADSFFGVSPTFRDVSWSGSIPTVEIIRNDPDDSYSYGAGPVEYSEEFSSEFTDIDAAWFNADNSTCVIPTTTKEEYSASQSGAYLYSNVWKSWFNDSGAHVSFSNSEIESSSMSVSRTLDIYSMLPMSSGPKKLVLSKHRFAETSTASFDITGTWNSTYGRIYDHESTASSTYSVDVESRCLLLVDPFLDLVLYTECVFSYSKDISTSLSFSHGSIWADGLPRTAESSYGGSLPSLPAVTLVMECHGVTTRTPLSWGDADDQEYARRSMAAGVAIPIDTPAVSWAGSGYWSNFLNTVQTLQDCTLMFRRFPVGDRDIGNTRTDSRASMTKGVNVRGKILAPDARSLVTPEYAKDPLTGAAVLIVRGGGGAKGLGADVLAYTIDKSGAHPLSSLLPLTDPKQITMACPA